MASPSPVVLVLSMLMSCLWFTGAVNEEGAALLLFKGSIKGDPDGCLQNWNSSDETPCSWNGISCQDMRVVSISIPNRKLVGTLSPSLGSLLSLRHINLRNNLLQGSLPMELFKAQGLQSLVFYGNNFSGSLPPNVGGLSYLQILNLAQNSVGGSIPGSLLQCNRLRTLDVSFNRFSGHLPDGFGAHLNQLEKLDLSHNGFDGQVPSDLGNLSRIQGTLDLSHNNFSGPIPASLGNLPEKVYIDLSDNNLNGPIPQNGALVNRGPTAFLGNPMLCGPPLKNPCQTDNNPSSQPYLPGSYSPPVSDSGEVGKSSKRRGLSSTAVIAIVASDIVGIVLIALAFLGCYWRLALRRSKVDGDEYGKEEAKERRDCLCFRKDGSETLSDNVEQLNLVQLDSQVSFDLDELLKASAFVLGKSGIGIVYKVVLEDGLTLAVRRLGEGGLQRFKEFQTEVEAIGKVRHPNIVALRAYYWSVDEKLLIYDYIPNGNLTAALHAGRSGTSTFSPISWLLRLSIMKGIAKGLAYLHEYSPKKYVHGDLTPSNILLGRNMEPCIADFGLGRLATIAGGSPMVQSNRVAEDAQQQSSEVSVSFPGSCYQAPEALKLLKPSQKWDVYSYGVILLEMISGRLPVILMGTSEVNIVKWVQLKIEEHKPLSDVLDPTLAQEPDYEEDVVAVLRIALACVHTNPERRPSMRHISDALDKLDFNG